MGWSCTQTAGRTLDKITKACVAETGSQNVFQDGKGQFFWETGREQDDGSIVGSIYTFSGSRKGSFKIDADGNVVKGSAAFKALAR